MSRNVLSFAFLAALVAICSAQSHNFELGRFESDMRLIHKGYYKMEGKFLRVVEMEVTLPEKHEQYTPIKYIKVWDSYNNGNGGEVKVLDGGLNFSNVTLKFKSKRSHGFGFNVEIYGSRF